MRRFLPAAGVLPALLVLAPLFAVPGARAAEFPVEARRVPDMKAMFGQVQSRDITPARARIGGVLVERRVDEGARVKAGDVIAVVSDEKLALQAQALDGQLDALRSQLDNAQDALRRASDLLPRGFVTRAAYDQARTNVDVLAHQIEAMRSQRAVVAQQMTEGEVLAPRDGVVLTASAIPGAVVLPGEAIARIAAGALYLRLGLPERHAALLKLGAEVLLPGESGEMRRGKIVKIYPEIENGRVLADAEVEHLDGALVGQRVKVLANVGDREALLVPRAAILTRSGVDYAQMQGPNGPLDVAVVFTPSADPQSVEILSGLRAGDKVLTP